MIFREVDLRDLQSFLHAVARDLILNRKSIGFAIKPDELVYEAHARVLAKSCCETAEPIGLRGFITR